tara:strand:+ start:148 stop:1086 length:939 start_codon:yes stop_codon:yes gene_type:complete
MKNDPLSFILNKDFKFNKKIYFISGNEITLMEKIKVKIIENYQKSEHVFLENIDLVGDFNDSNGLFGEKKIYLVKNFKGLDEITINKIKSSTSVFIFMQENSQKLKKLKTMLIKDNEASLIDCYQLDKDTKSRVLNEFFKLPKITIGQDLYWLLVEKLDNRYGFLEDSLNKILELNQKDITFKNIKKILSISDAGKERVFFSLLNKNKDIVKTFREKVVDSRDVNDFYYYCKFFCQLIIDSKNEEEYNKKIPTYLFKEKSFLIDLYRRYNSKKKKLLLNLLFSTEKTLRKESGLSLISGLRFFLNIKKITIS